MIPLAEPLLRGNEWRYIKECLDTNWVSSVGSFVNRFEELFAHQVGAQEAVAVSSGTAALHLALRALGIGPGDLVLTPSLTFVATTNAILYVGAEPVLMDSDQETWNISTSQVELYVTSQCHFDGQELRNLTTGRRVRALMVVHLYGHPADLDPLVSLCRRYRLDLIEDATESLGAAYKGRPVGTFGRAACFSFNGNKLITTGGGGMVVTSEPELASRARFLSTQARLPEQGYYHPEVGYNYRLTNIQAAMGVAQMEQVGDFLARKRSIAAHYRSRLGGVRGLTLSPEAPWAESAFWLFSVLVDPFAFGHDRDAVLARLNREGIQARAFFIPNHLLPPYQNFRPGEIPVAEGLYAGGINLPSSVGIRPTDLDRVCDVILDLAAGHGS